MKDRGKSTGHVDYLSNSIKVGDIIVYSSFRKARTLSLKTGEVVGFTPQKLKVKPLGKSAWEWAFPTAIVNIKNLSEAKD